VCVCSQSFYYKISSHLCRKRLITRCQTLSYLAFVLYAMTLCSLYIVSIISTNTTFVRGLFDKFGELCNQSVNFEYFFLKFNHVIYVPDVNTLFEFQSSYSLSSLNIGYHSNVCVASCRALFFTEIVIYFFNKTKPSSNSNIHTN